MDPASETAGLIQPTESTVEISHLPPRWVDVVDQVEHIIDDIRADMKQLQKLYKAQALPGFEDRTADEQALQRLTDEITASFHRAQNIIKSIIKKASQNPQDELMARNVQTSLATKVQELSTEFRKQQSSHLRRE